MSVATLRRRRVKLGQVPMERVRDQLRLDEQRPAGHHVKGPQLRSNPHNAARTRAARPRSTSKNVDIAHIREAQVPTAGGGIDHNLAAVAVHDAVQDAILSLIHI